MLWYCLVVFMVLKDNQYSKIYIKNYKLNVCLSRLLDTGGTGKRAILIMSLCSIFLWPDVLKGQKKRTFSIVHLPVPDGTGRRAIFKVLSACPVCQTGQADWPFSLSRLSQWRGLYWLHWRHWVVLGAIMMPSGAVSVPAGVIRMRSKKGKAS